jgi:hypothetical protein
MNVKINYQQIYEEELTHPLPKSIDKAERFFDLPPGERQLVEELVDAGYRRALEDALDPELLADTAALAGDMGTQLYNFANMLQAYLAEQNNGEDQ